MGLTLYFGAKRAVPMTEQENEKVSEIINRFYKQYPLEELPDFGMFDCRLDKDAIYDTGIDLPFDTEPELFYDMALYWLKCFTEITNYLSDAECKVVFEDVELIFDEETGWRFPDDEEYTNMQLNDL